MSPSLERRPPPPRLVDAHHHFWDLQAGRYPWLQDAPEPHFFLGDYGALRRDYLPADLRRDAAGCNLVASVHVEAERARDDQVGETLWLHGLHAGHGLPSAIVAHAWFHTPEAEQVLAAQARQPLVRGIRSKPVTAPRPDAVRPRGAGSMHDPAWLRGLSRLSALGLSWDLRVPYWHLDEAAAVARQFPQLAIVLNHTGFPWDRSPEGLAAWRRGMQALAKEPNVHLKVSELGLADQPWTVEGNRGVVREAIAIFGIARCMFASNFPVASLRIGYAALVDAMQQILHDFDDASRDAFFCGNALRFYRISLNPTEEHKETSR